MKHIELKRPHFHLSPEAQKKWMYTAIAVIAVAAIVALGWYAGMGGFGEWALFEE